MKKRCFSLIFCLLLLVSLLPHGFCTDTPVLLALGDSIASGYALSDASQGFPEQLASRLGMTCVNRAVAGQTSGELLNALSSGQHDTALRSASVIVISVGANDLLRELSAGGASDGLTASLYLAILRQLTGSGRETPESLRGIADRLAGNLDAIFRRVAELSPGTPVIAVNIPNPYNGQTLTFGSRSFDLGAFAEEWISPLNAAFPVISCYILADIHAVFDRAGLTNADIRRGEYDPHPNAEGHRRIADAILDAVPLADWNRLSGVSASDWYCVPVRFAAARTVFSSYSHFDPGQTVTRGGFVRALGRYAGISAPAYLGQTGFSDVPAARTDAPYIRWAVSAGIVKGTGDGKFSPDAPITREQLCVLLAQYLAGSASPSGSPAVFTDDYAVSGWARMAVRTATSLGLVQGFADGSFCPQKTVTGAELAAVLLRLHNLESRG
ncbi:MAG: S-layer homology domain-containing protein [Clostridiaceae bacterium]|nr:S-layer homology domain-containing protein [Clostridiaceae bacterium]